MTGFFSDFINEGKRIFMEDFISVIPDAVGYTAMVAGGLMVLSPLIGRSVVQSFGIFVFVSLLGATVMGAF